MSCDVFAVSDSFSFMPSALFSVLLVVNKLSQMGTWGTESRVLASGSEVSISALETAAKIPDPIDCSTTSCPHSGPTQVLDDRQVGQLPLMLSVPTPKTAWGIDQSCHRSAVHSIDSALSRARWYGHTPGKDGRWSRGWDHLLACSAIC